MTIEQFFRSQPSADAIVVCERGAAPRVLASAEVYRRSDAVQDKPLGPRKLLSGLIAFRKEGKKK
jgi:hypothetical protein